MKIIKHILSILIILVLFPCGISGANVIIKNGNRVMEYDTTELSIPLNNSIEGDTIYLSDGIFTNGDGPAISITKSVTLIGSGPETCIYSNVNVDIPNTPLLSSRLFESLTIGDLYHNCYVYIKSPIKGLSFKKCQIQNISILSDADDVKIDRCYISQFWSQNSYLKNCIVNNSYIGNTYGTFSNSQFTNCFFSQICAQGGILSYGDFKGKAINSIIYTSSSSYAEGEFVNCLLSSKIYTGYSTLTNCYSASETEIRNLDRSVTSDLISLGYIGTDGTAVGEYGGQTPFSLIPECPAPRISDRDGWITISCFKEASEIYYTINNDDIKSNGIKYTEPIYLHRNGIVKAYAKEEGYDDSEVVTYVINKYITSAPNILCIDNVATISTISENATIYYTTDGTKPTEYSKKYAEPITLSGVHWLKAISYIDEYNISDVSIYDTTKESCKVPEIIYDGRYVTLTCDIPYSRLYYTVDGSTPTPSSFLFDEKFDANGIIAIKAIAFADGYNNSLTTAYNVPAYFDGECATVATAGSLEQGFGWCGTTEIEKIEIRGTLNANDLNTLASMPSIKHIDLSTVNVENNSIPSRAFANMPIVSILMPQSIKTVGNNIFDGCDNLAAIQWNPYIPLTATAMSGIDNPNLLLYVSVKSYAPNSIRNVVVDGTADNIVLSDGTSNNFYCPIRFKAKRISYTHTYTQKTIVGVCAGWETLALPFDVKSIRHSHAGEIAPFAAENTEAKPFWLYALSSTGFEPATAIEANTPYIISMPNNDSYADDYILAGDVTFSAENIDVEVTTQNITKKGLVSFIPTTLHVDKSQDVYAINKNEPYEGKSEGSMFVLDLRDVSPFEGYWSIDGGAHRAKAFGVFDVNDFSFEMPIIAPDKSAMRVYTIGQTLYIETVSNQRVNIYSINGSLIKTVDVPAGTTKVTDLLPGFYIVNNVKIIIE